MALVPSAVAHSQNRLGNHSLLSWWTRVFLMTRWKKGSTLHSDTCLQQRSHKPSLVKTLGPISKLLPRRWPSCGSSTTNWRRKYAPQHSRSSRFSPRIAKPSQTKQAGTCRLWFFPIHSNLPSFRTLSSAQMGPSLRCCRSGRSVRTSKALPFALCRRHSRPLPQNHWPFSPQLRCQLMPEAVCRLWIFAFRHTTAPQRSQSSSVAHSSSSARAKSPGTRMPAFRLSILLPNQSGLWYTRMPCLAIGKPLSRVRFDSSRYNHSSARAASKGAETARCTTLLSMRSPL